MKEIKGIKMKTKINSLVPLAHGEGDGGDKDWKDVLPEEMRGNAVFADIKDIGALGTSFINAQSLIGQPAIRIPSENASDEDVKSFYEKVIKHAPNLMPKPDLNDESAISAIMASLGRPADAETYSIEGATLTPEMKKQAHEMNLTQKQFAKMYEKVIKPNIEAQAANEATTKAGRDALAKEWGYAFQGKEKDAQTVLEKTGAPAQLIEQAKAGKLGADTLRWMDRLVTALGSEGLNIIGNEGGNGRMTKAEASAQIQEMISNPKHAYWNKMDVGNASAMKDMIDLQRIANQ